MAFDSSPPVRIIDAAASIIRTSWLADFPLAATPTIRFNQTMRSILWSLMALSLFLPDQLFADGKMYAEQVNTSIPYQRALIIFDKGRQTMVLQSQYEIPNQPGNHKLGWVVPVPAVPELFSMDARDADWLFRMVAHMSRPSQFTSLDVLGWLIMAGFATGVCSFILSFLADSPVRKRLRRKAACLLILISVPGFLVLFVSARAWKGGTGVEIISAGQVGIYDTKVIKAESAEVLIGWLNQNSFRFDESDVKTFQSYIDRGWCFTTATVDASVATEESGAVSSNLLAPLILDFSTPNPVYPTALTATGGHDTEILIYLISSMPMKPTSDLKLRFLAKSEGCVDLLYRLYFSHMNADTALMDSWRSKVFHLHKFKSTLTSFQMAEDIEFIPHPEAQPYRETEFKF